MPQSLAGLTTVMPYLQVHTTFICDNSKEFSMLRQDWSPESESLMEFLTRFVTFCTRCQYVNVLPGSVLVFNCLHSVAPGYLITMCQPTVCQPVSKNPGRRYLRSAVRRDLVVPATRIVRFGPRSFCCCGTVHLEHSSCQTPKPATLRRVLPSSSENCTVSQTVQHFISTLVTVLNCKNRRTLTDRTYLLT